MTTNQDFKLDIFSVDSKQNQQLYKKYLRTVNSSNPFYKLELLQKDEEAIKNLRFFVFFKSNEPIALMNVYMSSIKVENELTDFFDISSPYGYSGPLYIEGILPEEKHFFWNYIDNWYRSNNVISEFIRFSLNDNHLEYTGTSIPSLRNVKGEIVKEKLQWESFKSKIRNNVRKAISNELDATILHKNITKEAIDIFHAIYISTMTRNAADKSYFFSKEYFQNFIRHNPDSCALIIVYSGEIPISTELILLDSSTIYSYLGGTNADFFHLRPNEFLKIKILEWARSKDNYKYFVLGGGRKNEDNLYKYKKTFFPKEEDVIYYTGRKVINESIYKKLINQHGLTDSGALENDFFPLYRKP